MTRLTGKVCVIAGAAGVIGEAVADRFRNEGGTVVGIDQREHAVGELSLRADLTMEVEVEQAFARIHRQFGRIDVLVNNAGLNDRDDHSALDMAQETWDRVFAANLTTTFLGCKHAIPYMLTNDPPSGSVINTGSFLAEMGAATAQMAFSAAKVAVIQLSRDLGTNLARRGVRVNALCLGPIETPQLRELLRQPPARRDPEAAHPQPDGPLRYPAGVGGYRGVPGERGLRVRDRIVVSPQRRHHHRLYRAGGSKRGVTAWAGSRSRYLPARRHLCHTLGVRFSAVLHTGASSGSVGAGVGCWRETTKSLLRMRTTEQIAPTRARTALTISRTSSELAKLA